MLEFYVLGMVIMMVVIGYDAFNGGLKELKKVDDDDVMLFAVITTIAICLSWFGLLLGLVHKGLRVMKEID